LQHDAEKQTLEDGYLYFQRQVKELQWAEQRKRVVDTIWKYRRPASVVGVAVFFGVLSFYIKKSSGGLGFWSALHRWSHIWKT
jgi:hypothetical protein